MDKNIGGRNYQMVVLVDPDTGDAVMPAGTTHVVPVDRSGSITTGGTAQEFLPVNGERKGFWIFNMSAGDLWINELGPAADAPPSFRIEPNSYYESPASLAYSNAISIYGATDGQAFTAREW